MPGARTWLTVAKTRLNSIANSLIDPNGVLIENSPYYDFYSLDKLWQIATWSRGTDVTLSAGFNSQVTQMINYATYILQPDSEVPVLGASLETTINNHGSFAQMA